MSKCIHGQRGDICMYCMANDSIVPDLKAKITELDEELKLLQDMIRRDWSITAMKAHLDNWTRKQSEKG